MEKTSRVAKRLLVISSICFALLVGVTLVTISSSATSHVYAATQPTTSLPSCTDPTGQNLPCMIVISTLPPPPNAIQCQETSGQILPCSYLTQNLSTGEPIVVITVYVPANYVFSSPTVIKVVVHETTSTTSGRTDGGKTISHKLLVAIGIAKDPIVRGNIQTVSVTVSDSKIPSKKILGAQVSGEVDYASHKTTKTFSGVTDSTGQMTPPYSWQIGGNSDNGTFGVKAKASKSGYSEGFATKTFRVICKFATECGHMINQTNSTIQNNMTNTTSTGPVNMTVTKSGGSGTGTTCVNNCTTGTTPPTVDCSKNLTDPSCAQTLTPSTTSPTTKTCPDGSVIDFNANCPASSSPSPPSNNPTPPSSSTPSEGSGGNNGGGNGGGGGGSSGSSGSDGGSNPSPTNP